MKRLAVSIATLAFPALANADGVLLEAHLGAGVEHYSGSASPDPWLGLGASVGIWLNPTTALTLRVAGVGIRPTPPDPSGLAMARPKGDVFVGPGVKAWLGDHVWVGGGVGIAQHLDWTYDGSQGWALDLRAGYTFAVRAASSLDISIEMTPSYYPTGGGVGLGADGMIYSNPAYNTGIMLLAGYQHR